LSLRFCRRYKYTRIRCGKRQGPLKKIPTYARAYQSLVSGRATMQLSRPKWAWRPRRYPVYVRSFCCSINNNNKSSIVCSNQENREAKSDFFLPWEEWLV